MTAAKQVEQDDLQRGMRVRTTSADLRGGVILAVVWNASDGITRYVVEMDPVRPDFSKTPTTVRVYLRPQLRQQP